MAKFPKTPNFTGYNEPQRYEADLLDLEVEGELPSDLNGAFFHVRPDPQFPPRLGDDIYFGGDGAVSRFRIQDGKVDFKHRYVRTDKFVAEREAGKALFGAYRNPLTDDQSVQGKIRGTANTNVLVHSGKLWALKEDSPPVLMDPNTLETLGYTDLDGRMSSQTFTAHPKVDPETGQMIAFGYAAKGLCTASIAYHEISPDGKLTKEIFIEPPYYSMIHDFAVTRDYVVFPIIPLIGSWERLKAGLPHFGYDSSKDTYLGVMRRGGEATEQAKTLRWFKAPACFNAHIMNAFNEGEKIHIDLPVSATNGMPFFPDVSGAPWNPQDAAPMLTRWTIDMGSKSDGFEKKVIAPIPGELPRIDDRYHMSPYRHGWYHSVDPSKPVSVPGGPGPIGLFFINLLIHQDHLTGAPQTYWGGEDVIFQECQFVPKSASAAEAEGHLLAMANHANSRRTDLLVFDALRLAEGPRATIRLPFMLRSGVHGNWCDGSKLSD
jgi:carotenoid cleavage dioxygenase-like enzyme